MAVSTVNRNDIHAGALQRADPVQGVLSNAHGPADAQSPEVVLARVRVLLYLHYVLYRNESLEAAFLIHYQDRVMMGKDGPFEPTEYHVYFRVLETADEYFDYYRRRHANWKMYGLDLPDTVLRKVYYENALRIVTGIDRSGFPAAGSG